MTKRQRNLLVKIIAGAVLFAVAVVIKHVVDLPWWGELILFLAVYAEAGWDVIYKAGRNIAHGQIFDENFLMAVASVAAFAIGEYPEAVEVILFYQIGTWFEQMAVGRSRQAVSDLLDLCPDEATVLRDGKPETVLVDEVEVGEHILVRAGEKIPLDAVVFQGHTTLDTAALTGESMPASVKEGDEGFSGCVNLSGAIELTVTKPASESTAAKIMEMVESSASSKAKTEQFITKFARYYTPCVVIAAVILAVLPPLITGQAWSEWIYRALTFLIISCPCALVLSVPLTYFSGIGAGSRRGILFKGGASLEALNNVKTIVMDKTGTITKGNFVVQKVVPAQGVPLDENELLWLAAACEGASTHPIAKSIINSYEERKTSAAKAGDFSLVAVGATVENIREQAGEGVFAELEGKTILCGNVKLMERNNIDLSGYHGTPGSTEVLLAMDGHFLGHVDISDTIKADANSAISRMKAQGLTTAMLTGDGQASADAVAQEVGIDEVRARLLPQDKLSALTDIREKCGAVMFVGDGINDAPVLAGADVGAAMGSGADAAIEAADVVFMKADLTSIPISVKIARKANIVSKENIVFALAVKILVMILGLFGIASMWLAVFADTGVAMLCVLNSIRMLYMKTE